MILLAGGGWDNSSRCGSRCRSAANSLSSTGVHVGARGRSPSGAFVIQKKKY